ncbi:MAG: hypothetical protein GW946_04270 [Candidatus Pacebacteria bacterium]|nr:hypothetical protein [Candidatus Paceibacterota bacterium]
MLSIPHALTGAFVASQFPSPVYYVPGAFGLHYLQDWIPHWDFGTGLSTGKRKKSTAILLELCELVVTFALIYFVFQYGKTEIQYHIWAGALMGIMPDFIEAPRNFLKWEPFFLKPLNEFHGLFHNSTHNKFAGLLPQVLTVLVILWLVFRPI